MNFDFTDDQHEIKRTARDLLAKRSTLGARARAPPRAGATTTSCGASSCELGWPGIAIAEEHGGQGLGVVELVILLEELGYALRGDAVPRHARSPAWRSRPRARDAAARALAARAGERRAARRARHGARRRGELVPDAAGADVVVLVEGDGADARAGAPTPTSTPVDAIDPTRRYGVGVAATGEPLAGRRRGRRSTARGRGLGRARRRLPARARDERRLRQGPQAVRHAGRRLPGRLAPLRADAARHRGRALGDLLRRLGGRRRARAAARGGGARQGRGVGRPAARSRRRRSRSTAASASPGRPTCTGCTSARRSTRAARRRRRAPRAAGADRGGAAGRRR